MYISWCLQHEATHCCIIAPGYLVAFCYHTAPRDTSNRTRLVLTATSPALLDMHKTSARRRLSSRFAFSTWLKCSWTSSLASSPRKSSSSSSYPSTSSPPPKPYISMAGTRSCQGMSADELCQLWRCMLQLQRLYGCYRSTRISLAADAADGGVSLMRTYSLCLVSWGS